MHLCLKQLLFTGTNTIFFLVIKPVGAVFLSLSPGIALTNGVYDRISWCYGKGPKKCVTLDYPVFRDLLWGGEEGAGYTKQKRAKAEESQLTE